KAVSISRHHTVDAITIEQIAQLREYARAALHITNLDAMANVIKAMDISYDSGVAARSALLEKIALFTSQLSLGEHALYDVASDLHLMAQSLVAANVEDLEG